MKKLTIIALAASLAACGGGTDTAGMGGGTQFAQTAVMRQSTTANAATSVSAFLSSAFLDGQAEIRLSQLALQKAASNEVKGFAQRMIDDHTAANGEIRQLAQRYGITLPSDATADQEATFTQLSGLTGDAFDRAYMEHNVTVHQTDVAAFRQQAQAAGDAALAQQGQPAQANLQTQEGQVADTQFKTFVDATLPVLKLHLSAAEEINNLLNPDAFLMSAYRDGLAEIQLSQLALQKAASADVKAFAQRMVDEHTSANGKISQLALARGVTLPTALAPEQQATATDLARFTGADFDQAYMDVNVIMHAKDVFSARRQYQEGNNTEVKALALSLLPALAEHLIRAADIDRGITPSFFYTAAQDSAAEIALSHLALQKSSNQTVKTYAQRMIDDHTAASLQVAKAAQQQSRALPTELSPEQMAILIRLYGANAQDFDRLYMDYNVRAHQHDVQDTTTQSQQSTDPASQTLAAALLPVLQAHLTQAQQIQQQLQQAQTAQGAGAAGTGATGAGSGGTGSAGTGTSGTTGTGMSGSGASGTGTGGSAAP